VSVVFLYLSLAAVLTALAATMLCGPHRFMRGRHVSKVLVRRIGYRAALLARGALPVVALPLPFTGHYVPYVVLMGSVAVWSLDDWLFPDDDDRKRKHEWARVRLQMPKPVKLRPVEKWAGAPA
jgi:hypothetical protein